MMQNSDKSNCIPLFHNNAQHGSDVTRVAKSEVKYLTPTFPKFLAQTLHINALEFVR